MQIQVNLMSYFHIAISLEKLVKLQHWEAKLYKTKSIFTWNKKSSNCNIHKQNIRKKLVILEKRQAKEKDGRKCMIKSFQYKEESGWVTIPQNERRRKDFCEAIGVPSVQPWDRLSWRHFLPTDFRPKFLKSNAVFNETFWWDFKLKEDSPSFELELRFFLRI